jgi:regulator of sigma E protease
MVILIKVIQFLLSLSILIIVHECGHFFFAKLFKARVEKFYLFFDPWFSLFKYKKGETEYGIGWLPLGGYVKISGMIDESMDREAMKLPPQPYEFRSKPTWQRLLIMLGGVMVNFIMALVIYAGVLYVWGYEYLPTANAKYGIMITDTLGYQVGLKNGDKIISVDNEKVEDFHHVISTLLLNQAKTIQIYRDSSAQEIQITQDDIAKFIKTPYFFDARMPFVVDDFGKSSVAKDAGMLVGDSIVALNDQPVFFFDEYKTKIQALKGQQVKITVIRKSKSENISLKVPETGILGIVRVYDYKRFLKTNYIHYSILKSIPAGIKRGITACSDYLKQIPLIFSRKTKGYESLGGFYSIGKIFPGVWDWQAFWSLTAFLSIILAIMNILPIPALDGGHVLFLLYEIITGRKPSDKFLEYAQITGMILLLALLLFANGNDVVRLVKDVLHK